MSHNYYSLHNFVDHKIVDQHTLMVIWPQFPLII